MRFARVHKAAAYALALLGLGALGAGGELHGAFAVFLALGVAASWWAEGPLLQRAGWLRAWNAFALASLALEGLRAVTGAVSWLTASVEFAALLQLSRLSNRRSAREYQQLTQLATLHLIGATVLGGGLSYALCFMGFVVVLPWSMTLGHLRSEIEGNYLADARTGRAGLPIDVARILRSRRVVGPGLLLGSSVLALPIFAITSLLFVLFPRLGLGIFSLRGAQGQAVSGLGEQVDLAGHGTIRSDPTIVLRVEPSDLGPSPPLERAFRLRGAAFDSYNGRSWVRESRARRPVPREGSYFELRHFGREDGERSLRVTLDAIDPPVVLLPPRTTGLRVEPHIEAGFPRYPELSADPSDEVRYSSTDELGLVYTVFLPEGDNDRRGDGRTLRDEQRLRYLSLPPLTPEVVALAQRLTAGQDTAVGRAEAVQHYLHTFRYTLTLVSGEAARPLDDFLLRTHAGHCEYFSTAMAVLLRAVGVPTRNVTGFLGGSYNRFGRFYAIRQGDAHSWVEVYDPAQGWLTFDPTPPSRELAAPAPTTLGELDLALEALRVRWRRYVINYDLGTQGRMALRAVRWLTGQRSTSLDPTLRPSDAWTEIVRSLRAPSPRPPWRTLGALASALLAGAVVWRVWRLRRRRARTASAKPSSHQREALVLLKALDVALERRGLARPANRSPLAWAQELRARNAAVAPAALALVQRYLAARFGSEALLPGEHGALLEALHGAPPEGATP